MKRILRLFDRACRATSLACALGAMSFVIPAHAAPAAGSLEIVRLEPTVIFPNREPLAQRAVLTLRNLSAAPVAADVVVSTPDGRSETLRDTRFAGGDTSINVLVPDIAAPATIHIAVRAAGAVVAQRDEPWQPQRKWKVYIIKSSHEDLGYENYIYKKQHDIANFMDLAHEIVRPRVIDESGHTRRTGYHYTLETMLFPRNYIDERGLAAWRAFAATNLKAPNPGMSLMAAPSGVHTHWMDYEEIARMTYPGRREARDRFGLDLKTVTIVDNPSLSWAGAQAFASAGIKYVGRWGQSWRTGGNNAYAQTKLPPIFWWQAPDGVHRVLFAWASSYGRMFWWGQTNGSYQGDLQGLPEVWMNTQLQKVERGDARGPYPYDAIVVPSYSDHETPKFDDRIYQEWCETVRYPEIKIAGPEQFFAYMEKAYGDRLPTLRGDLNNFSGDYSSIDPVSQGWKRDAARLLPAAEGVGVIAGALDPAFALPPAEVERTYTRLFDYDEHSWPTLPPASDEQIFNANWVKHDEGRRAIDASTRLFNEAAAALGAQVQSRGEGTFAVFNSVAHVRSSVVRLPGAVPAVVDVRSGRTIACDPDGHGGSTFLATDVPAFGYALFRQANAPVATAAAAPELKCSADTIENRFYRVRFDRQTGTIASIVDKETGRELIDPKAPYRANQLVYVHKKERESLEGFEHSPTQAQHCDTRVDHGRVVCTAIIDDARIGGQIEQTVLLYAGLKRIDIHDRLTATAVMWSPHYEDRYRDNLFYAFPFAVPGGQFRVESAGGIVRPYDDQLRWGSHDFLTANRWVDVSNADGGVTLTTRQASTCSFGEIRYNHFSIDYRPSKPWLFSYAWSNRMAGLLTLQPSDCNATFDYSLTSHDGGWNAAQVTAAGWNAATPLLVVPVRGGPTAPLRDAQKSFLRVDADNVQLTVLKAAGGTGGGWIARLVETEGRGGEVELDASALGVERAALCNLVEDDESSLAVSGGKVRVPLRPFGFATIRLIAGATPAAVASLEARSLSDSSIALHWAAPAGGADAYEVYRSVDPDEPASVYSAVARVARPEYVDRGLDLGTRYFYRVAAIRRGNALGRPSAQAAATTTLDNRTPPAPVRQLGIVRCTPHSVIVYWNKPLESDVARYLVYRSESPEFPANATPVATIPPTSYFLQVYRDDGLTAGRKYYYRVESVDWANNRQTSSPVASAVTPAAAGTGDASPSSRLSHR